MVSTALCEKLIDPWMHLVPFLLLARDMDLIKVVQAERNDVAVD